MPLNVITLDTLISISSILNNIEIEWEFTLAESTVYLEYLWESLFLFKFVHQRDTITTKEFLQLHLE